MVDFSTLPRDVLNSILNKCDAPTQFVCRFVSIGPTKALNNTKPIIPTNKKDWRLNICDSAANHDHISQLKWALRVGYKVTENTIRFATCSGSVEVITLVHYQIHPIDIEACQDIAHHGRVKILQWMHDSNMHMDERISSRAGSVKTLEWFRKNNIPINSVCYEHAVRHNKTVVIEWLLEHDIPKTIDACIEAASVNNLELLKWLRSKGFEMDMEVCYKAAAKGNVEMIKYAVSEGLRLDWRMLGIAVKWGHLNVIEYLLGNGIRWNESYIDDLIDAERLDILQWLHKSNYDVRPGFEIAKNKQKIDVIMWYTEIYPEKCLFEIAIGLGNLELMKEAYLRDGKWTQEASNIIFKSCNRKLISWMIENIPDY